MAKSLVQTTNIAEEDDKIELIGNLIMKIESVLSPKPINVWHLPGALKQILSSTLQIFTHGCKTDIEGNSQLWNFIFGLRVIRPDLWPTYELKSKGCNLSDSELMAQWLELSLQAHLLLRQLKTLLDDRKRLHTYYHPWAFLRTRKYTDALLIVLQALEHNSQDKLATLNPSLMVKFYSKKKKKEQAQEIPFSLTRNSEKIGIDIGRPNSTGIEFPDIVDGLNNSELRQCKKETNDCLAVWEDDHLGSLSSKVSHGFLKVDYDNTVLSDGERTDTKINMQRASVNKESCELVQRPQSERDLLHLSSFRRTQQVSLYESSSSLKLSDASSIFAKTPKIPFVSSSAGDLKEVSAVTFSEHNNVVQPSPFLIEYLVSKSRFPASACNPILRERLDDNDIESISSAAQSFIFGELDPNIEKERNPFIAGSPTQNTCSPSSASKITNPSQQQESLRKTKKSISPVASQQSEVVKTKRSHIRSHSDGFKGIVAESPIIQRTSVSFPEKQFSSTVATQMTGAVGSKSSARKSFMEDGGQSITPVADGFFPKPQPGQTLLDFLTSAQFTKASAQLDRENAHFSVAEAVLAAIEQMNYENGRKGERRVRHQIPDESEEDISSRQQLPSHRRKLRDRSSVPFFPENSDEEPVTTDHSIFDSPEPQSSEESESQSTSGELGNEISGDSDEHNQCSADPLSAENVAIAILMHYNSRLLPKANELQWLVSEQEAPQKLLPMPSSVPVSPDDAQGETFQPLLRGTSDWAPPRPQLILTLHKNTKRKARLIDQKWRCAGCGLLVSEKLSSYFRLCHYLGRFFCTSCHINKKAIVPAKVLHKWDFNKYAVCNFSYELLIRMSADPLFHLGTLNPRLYRQSRDLHQTLIYRLQLFHARAYIFTCSKAVKEKSLLECVPVHWSTEPHVYSLDDLVAVKKGAIMNQTKHLTTACIKHISSCPICLGQGFICEICREGSPIFPFQLDAVTQCTKCKECFHFLCFSPNGSCPRCERRDRREGKKAGTTSV